MIHKKNLLPPAGNPYNEITDERYNKLLYDNLL